MLRIFNDVTTKHSHNSYSFNACFYALIEVIICPSAVKFFNDINDCNIIARNKYESIKFNYMKIYVLTKFH